MSTWLEVVSVALNFVYLVATLLAAILKPGSDAQFLFARIGAAVKGVQKKPKNDPDELPETPREPREPRLPPLPCLLFCVALASGCAAFGPGTPENPSSLTLRSMGDLAAKGVVIANSACEVASRVVAASGNNARAIALASLCTRTARDILTALSSPIVPGTLPTERLVEELTEPSK